MPQPTNLEDDVNGGAAPAREHASAAPESFPNAAWRGLFALYRDLVGPTTEACDAFLFGSLAPALSFLAGREFLLPWGPGFMPPVVNSALLGKSAKTRKSTALEDVVDIVARPLMPKPSCEEEPPPAEIVVGLGSGEGFAEAIADQTWRPKGAAEGDPPEIVTGRRGLFVVHEFGALLDKVGRDQAGAMIDFALAAFDARAAWSHRTRARSSTRALTMTKAIGVFAVASTYAWLAKTLSETHVMAGLANRFLFLAGDSQRLLHRRPQMDPTAVTALQDEVSRALDAVRGREALVAPEADALHRDHYLADRKRVEDSEVGDAATARADILALRLSLLFALADGQAVLTPAHVEAAWTVVGYSNRVVAGLVARIHEQSMREVEERVLAAARRVSEKRGGSFTQRDIRQNVKGKTGMDAETFLRGWGALVEAGDIVKNGSGDTFVVADMERVS